MDKQDTEAAVGLFSRKQVLLCMLVSVVYLLLSYWLIGFKNEQLYLVALFNILYFFTPLTRKFITGFSVFIVFWVIFDFMKAWPNYLYGHVHIEELYLSEKKLFGIQHAGRLLTPNEFLGLHTNTFLDILTGISYLCWVPVPLAFAAYLFFRNRTLFLSFALSFLLVNLIGFVIYYVYPAAPPWYVQQHGFDFIASTKGNTAGLERFDRYFNIPVFQSLYSKSSNVFAAMPSLHAAYPVVVLYYSIKNKSGLVMNVFFMLVMMGIWFSAVYNSHHYILDILLGIACALAGIAFYQRVLLKNNRFQSFLRMFVSGIE